MPGSSRIDSLIADVAGDGIISDDEWANKLGPAFDGLPERATPATRALLALWADDKVQLSSRVRADMESRLMMRGYPMGESRTPQGMAAIIRGNISETDDELLRLLRLTGRERQETLVAVLDRSFDKAHPALAGKYGCATVEPVRERACGWDFVDNDGEPGIEAAARGGMSGPSYHGGFVAGVAAQGTDRVRVLPVRVTNDQDRLVTTDRFVEALEYAAERASVVNLSLHVDVSEHTLPADAQARAAQVAELEARVRAVREVMVRHPDVLFVLAAGNHRTRLGESSYDTPATRVALQPLPNLAVVAAADGRGKLAATFANADFGSNYGAPYVTHAARGARVWSAMPQGARYMPQDGTSFAAPNYANAAARCLLLDPGLRPEQVNWLLAITSDRDADWDGIVAARGTINEVRATRLAAMSGLVRRGMDVVLAAQRVGVDPGEREQYIAWASRL